MLSLIIHLLVNQDSRSCGKQNKLSATHTFINRHVERNQK